MFATLYAGGQAQIRNEFDASHVVVTLGIGLVSLGFAVGPLVYAPQSELYGRQPVYIAILCFVSFSFGAALSPNIESLLIFRLLAGTPGAAVFSNFGGSLADMFILTSADRSSTEPGKMARVLKREEEKGLRKAETGDAEGKIEIAAHVPHGPQRKNLWFKSLLTPLVLLACEPIVMATSTYHAFIYGLLFILLEGYPYVYSHTYSLTLSGLTFISPWIESPFGVLVYFGYFKPSYTAAQKRLYSENASLPNPLPNPTLRPESRLPGIVLASTLVLFWFAAASSYSHVHIIAPLLSGIPLPLANYYIDLYPTLSASALEANCFMRNVLATLFPTFATPMYATLGPKRASLVLAGIARAGVPAGIILLLWGEILGGMSKRAVKERQWDGQRGGWVAETKEIEFNLGMCEMVRKWQEKNGNGRNTEKEWEQARSSRIRGEGSGSH